MLQRLGIFHFLKFTIMKSMYHFSQSSNNKNRQKNTGIKNKQTIKQQWQQQKENTVICFGWGKFDTDFPLMLTNV